MYIYVYIYIYNIYIYIHLKIYTLKKSFTLPILLMLFLYYCYSNNIRKAPEEERNFKKRTCIFTDFPLGRFRLSACANLASP